MKKFLLIIFLFSVCNSDAQTFSGPESVEYDVANSRWLVGQRSSGKVLIYNPASNGLTELCTGMTSGPYGIEILGNILYCCDGGRIKGYDLASGTLVFNLNLAATFLNGITSDGISNLFVTDYSGKKIYRVNVVSNTFNQMTTTVKSPNGIIYDGANNRCVFVTWGSAAAIQAMSLADSTVSTLITTTLSNIDGIIRDQQGNYYVSAWGTSSLNMTDATFSYNPIAVKTGLSSPADLGINAAGDSIGIPNSGTANNVVFHVVSNTTGIQNAASNKINLFPNPSSEKVTITLENPVLNGTIELYDSSGQRIANDKANGLVFIVDRNQLPAGTYIVKVKDQKSKLVYSQKLIWR